MRKIITIAFAGLLAALGAACSKPEETNTRTTTTTTNSSSAPSNAAAPAAANSNATAPAADSHGGGGDQNVPATVRAALPDAQQITKQHKDISTSQSALIEREAGGKVPETDHHSYLAFSSTGGARRQVGAATVIKAGEKEAVIVYESREGIPYIKEVRIEGIAPAFLDQFKGKGHDDKFQIGGDLKVQGVDEATAKTIASAVRVDAVTMQTLYGAAHGH